MQWNLACEMVSILYLCIVWFNARKGYRSTSLKNRVFQICFLVTFFAILSNIVSTICINYYTAVPLWLNWTVTSFYFVLTPLMGVVYFCYAAAIIYEPQNAYPKKFWLYFIPAYIYAFIVIANVYFKWLFDFSPEKGYIRGPYIILTYIIFYIYCLASILVTIGHKDVNRSIRKVLLAFPIVAFLTVAVQQIFPNILLSGSAATMTLLIIYLYLQNQQISMDPILSIPNRRCFMDNIKLLIKSPAYADFYVLVFSLRDFKQVNEQFGQKQGDALLKEVARYLSNAAKPYRVYRFSGDEFAVVVTSDSQEQVMDLAGRLYDGIKRPHTVSQYHSLLNCAVGMVKYPDTVDSLSAIITGIEHAVIRAKNDKHSDFCVFTPAMLETTNRQREIISILKDAYEKDSFEVYFQPLWSVENQKFTVAESLLRLPHTSIGPIYPDEFIPMAESTGLIIGMTYQVLHKVCRFVRRALDIGIELDSVTINFSTLQFTQPDVAQQVLDIIESYDIPLRCIKIEITERTVVENAELFNKFVEEMNRHSIQVGLDDFGTGYCNLAAVTTIPLDFVKIDKSLLWSAMDNHKSSLMMRSLIHIIHQFGIQVVCEGAENEAQSNFCKASGVEWIQGYYYSHPLCAEDALHIMEGKPVLGNDTHVPAVF